ncbi:MAG: four helix bundle protein [Bacteroidota bacterium]
MHFKELGVYGLAVELRKEVFVASKAWPKAERYALTDQARRASRSVSANLGEAWAKRRYPRHFVSKLTDALGEAEETGVWLDVALECGYLDQSQHDALSATCRRIAAGLVKMARHPDPWCGPSTLVREDAAPYSDLNGTNGADEHDGLP